MTFPTQLQQAHTYHVPFSSALHSPSTSTALIPYLLLLYRIVVSIYACQGLRIPSKLVVARVCVDDSGAIIASRNFCSALWVCLSGTRGKKRRQNGDKVLHDGIMLMKEMMKPNRAGSVGRWYCFTLLEVANEAHWYLVERIHMSGRILSQMLGTLYSGLLDAR